MTKNELVIILERYYQSALYNIFSLQSIDIYNSISGEKPCLPGIKLTDGSIMSYDHFISNLASNLTRDDANRFVTRNWFKETFRLVKEYSSLNKANKRKLINQKWYNVANILCNALSHNSIYDLTYQRGKNRGKIYTYLPLKYKNISITKNEHGKPVSCKLEYIYEMCREINSFAIKELN